MNGFFIRLQGAKFRIIALGSLALALLGGCQAELDRDQDGSVETEEEARRNAPGELRRFIGEQVGGLDKLKVPADDAAIPLPPEDPARPGRYRTTEAKRSSERCCSTIRCGPRASTSTKA